MTTLAERVGDRALAGAIETLREEGIRVDETPYLQVDNRFCLVKALDYAWQWIVDMVKGAGADLEKYVIRPLFYNAALRRVVPLYPSRGNDRTSGFNAFLHLSGINEVMLSTFGSLEFAFQRMPVFAQRVRERVGEMGQAELRGSLEGALARQEIRVVLGDEGLKRQMIDHLQKIKEWELFLQDSQRARAEGDVTISDCSRFMWQFVGVNIRHVDVVELFHHVIRSLPYYPSFFGFEVLRAREIETGRRFVPRTPPQMNQVREQLGKGLSQTERYRSVRGEEELHLAPRPRVVSSHHVQLRAEPVGMVSLPFIPNVGIGFEQLKREYFSPPVPGVRWSSRGRWPSEMRMYEQTGFFEHCPLDVYFPIQRLCQEKRGHEAGKLTFHRDHLHVPLATTLPKRMGLETIDHPYSLVEFIAFQGDVDRGHYAYYKKEGHQWFECIDSRTRLVSDPEVRQILNDRSVLHHYSMI